MTEFSFTGTKILLGSGKQQREGYISVDKFVEAPYIVKGDALDLPFDDNSLDEIKADQLLEHLSRKEGEQAIKHWYKKLKRGGILSISVPNFAENMLEFLEAYRQNPNNVDRFLTHVIYGIQWHEGEYHKWGYTPESLCKLLQDNGFIDIEGTVYHRGDIAREYENNNAYIHSVLHVEAKK